MATDYKFEGWVAQDEPSADGNMKWMTYEPKPFEDGDIDISVSHCGVCGSDISHLRSGWKPADYPMIVGHELVGHVIRAGSTVRDIKVGDRVGVSAQCKSCLRCGRCTRDQEQHCQSEHHVVTYDARFPDGSKTYGGYANELPSEVAAPMLCGGLTVWDPLIQNDAGPGKGVGVIGVGGLGHFAVIFAKGLNCDKVVAISRSSSKTADALKMGADEFIATGEEHGWWKTHADSLDMIISTVSGSDFEIAKYLSLLDVNGILIQAGAPEDPIPAFSAFALLRKNLKIGGSMIRSRKSARAMLDFAANDKIKAWVEVRPMADANRTVVDLSKGKARYRYVLAN